METVDADAANRLLPHIAARVLNTPLMILPEKLDTILAVLGPRIGLDLAAPNMAAEGGAPAQSSLQVVDGIALLPVEGTLAFKVSGLQALSGMGSYLDIGDQLAAAVADPTVRGVLLLVDSPGGEVGGVFDLADKIRAASAIKPIAAIAEESATSAAYLIASAAGRVFSTQSGLLGSIGVVGRHVDRSQANAKNGIAVTYISAGAGKTHGNPDQPLDGDSLATLQARVDSFYALFVDKVAGFRAMAPAAVRALGARVMRGPEAVAAGLADEVGTADQAVAWVSQQAADVRAPSTKGVKPMEKPAWMTATVITPELLAAFGLGCPALASAVQAQGVTAERDRLTKLEALAEPGEEALLAKFKAEGVSVEAAALGFAEGRKAKRAGALAARTADTPAAVVTAPGTTAADAGATADKRPDAELTDDELTAKFAKSDALKAEFAAAADYVAYVRASAQGRVRIKTDRPAV